MIASLPLIDQAIARTEQEVSDPLGVWGVEMVIRVPFYVERERDSLREKAMRRLFVLRKVREHKLNGRKVRQVA